jgi:hypothetical protein
MQKAQRVLRVVDVRSSNAIAKVIESCLDDERTLARESRHVDADRGAVLTQLANERRRFVGELERLSPQHGRGSWGALRRELAGDLWLRAAGPNTGDAVEACRRSQHRTEVRYDRALELDWPPDVRTLLAAQHERIHAARYRLAELEYL